MTGIKGRRWGADIYLDPSIDVGAIPYKGANGKLLWLTPGAATQVITSNGVSPAIPSYQAGGGGGGGSGGLVLLEQHTASAAASLNFTTFISSTYDDFVFDLVGINPATNGAKLLMRVGTGGGPTYDSSGIYNYAFIYVHLVSAADTGSHGGTNATGISFFDDGGSGGLNSSNAPALNGTARLFDPQNASAKKSISFDVVAAYSGSSDRYHATGGGVYNSNTALTAVQFLMSSGNIASGTIRVYGVAK
jgi:hypothetical protein